MHLPLAGFRIISAEQYGAGPYGTMHLAQLGAEVIKIEPPRKNGEGGGDTARAVGPHFLREGESLYFQTFNLNKRSLTLDLRSPEGQQAFRKLVATSHAVANNMRGDLPEKLGLNYDALKDVNPAIVCAHLSAYGRDNERAKWPGYDYLMQAEAGYCQLTGEPGGTPQRMGLSMVDFMTGTIFAIGLLAALLDAQRTGRGRDVDTDLLSAALHQTSYPALWYMNHGDQNRAGAALCPSNRHPQPDVQGAGRLDVCHVPAAQVLGRSGRTDRTTRFARRSALCHERYSTGASRGTYRLVGRGIRQATHGPLAAIAGRPYAGCTCA